MTQDQMLFERARQALDAQAFSRLLGAHLESYVDGVVDLRVPMRDELRQQHGFAHGGVISYLADNALTMAGGLAMGPRVVTGEYKINYLRPALEGTLIARARALHVGRSQAICRCEISIRNGESEKLVALAQGTINAMSEDAGAGKS